MEVPKFLLDSKHYQVAQRRLGVAELVLIAAGIGVRHDNWPFHIVVFRNDEPFMSIYCGGFNEWFEVARLLDNGDLDDSKYEEKTFDTEEEVLSYVRKELKDDISM
jgi:hypothetical protein